MKRTLFFLLVFLCACSTALARKGPRKEDPRSKQTPFELSHGPMNVTPETVPGLWECFLYYPPRLFLVSVDPNKGGKIVYVTGPPELALHREFTLESRKVGDGSGTLLGIEHDDSRMHVDFKGWADSVAGELEAKFDWKKSDGTLISSSSCTLQKGPYQRIRDAYSKTARKALE